MRWQIRKHLRLGALLRAQQLSVRPEQREMVERWLNNYQEWTRKMEQICELNHVLLLAEE